MSQQDPVSITLTYTEQDWQAILDVIETGAYGKGGDWPAWASSFRRKVENIVQQTKAEREAGVKRRAVEQRKKSYGNSHDDYDEDYFDIRDLFPFDVGDLRDMFPDSEGASENDLWNMFFDRIDW